MIDKSSLLKSQGSLYLKFIPKDGLFHKMLLLSLMGFLTGWCNLYVLDFYIDNCYAQDRSYFKGIPQKNHKMENIDSLLGLGLLIYYPNHNINWPILC